MDWYLQILPDGAKIINCSPVSPTVMLWIIAGKSLIVIMIGVDFGTFFWNGWQKYKRQLKEELSLG